MGEVMFAQKEKVSTPELWQREEKRGQVQMKLMATSSKPTKETTICCSNALCNRQISLSLRALRDKSKKWKLLVSKITVFYLDVTPYNLVEN
jgi:hypothetical protein